MTKSFRSIFAFAIVDLIAVGAFAAAVNKTDSFLKAVEDRDVKAVKRFLAGGIDVKARDARNAARDQAAISCATIRRRNRRECRPHG